MNKQYDFVFCQVPKSNVDSPLIGAPILSGILKQHGYKSMVLDFNVELYQFYYHREAIYKSWQLFDNYFLDKKLFNNLINGHLKELIISWIDKIIELNPKNVGFTAFTSTNRFMIKLLARHIKEKLPQTQIIIGGPDTINIGPLYKNQKIIDHFVKGYGEDIILLLAKGNYDYCCDLNNDTFVSLNNYYVADFSDLQLSLYDIEKKEPFLYISSSRGCVKNCTFCDVRSIWNKVNFRSAELIRKELLYYISKYFIFKYYFADSAINSSMKYFRKLLLELKIIKKQYIDFKWEAFIILFAKNIMTEKDFDNLKAAGCYLIKIGIESGSDTVRRHMKKYFSNEDVLYNLSQCRRVGIKCDLFFIVGYPTETLEDFEQTKQLIVDVTEYKDIIAAIRIQPLTINKRLSLFIKQFSEIEKNVSICRYKELRELVYKNKLCIRYNEDERMQYYVHNNKLPLWPGDNILCQT